MNLKTIIIYIFLIKSAYSQIIVKKFDYNQNHIADAIKFVIKNYYYKKSSFINIIVESKSALARQHLNDVLENVLQSISYLTIQLANADISEYIEMNIHTLVMVDSAESFERVCNQYSKSRFNFNNYFLVYLLRLQRDTYSEITRIFKKVSEMNVVDIDVLVEIQQNKMALYTYFPYTKYHCKETALSIIDYIVNGTTMKKVDNIFDIFPDKTGNLHQCPINVFALPDPPFVVINDNMKTPYNYAGIAGRILSYLSIISNFSIVPVHDVEFDSMTGFQTTELLNSGAIEVDIGRQVCKKSQFRISDAYHLSRIVFVGQFGERYTPLERLFYPFTVNTWICILISTCIGIFTIKCLDRLSNAIKNFVIGPSNHTPTLNMINIILGGSVEYQPRRNFARYLLTMWFLLTIILRLSYQALLYDLIKSDSKKGAPETVEDILKHNYKILVTPAMYESVGLLPDIQKVAIITNLTELDNFKMIERTSDKVTILTSLEYFKYYKKHINPLGSLGIVKETVFIQRLCIYFGRNSFLKNLFDFRIGHFHDAGMLDKFITEFIDDRIENIHNDNIPTKLNIYQIFGIFQIFIILLMISICVFIYEVVSMKYDFIVTCFKKLIKFE